MVAVGSVFRGACEVCGGTAVMRCGSCLLVGCVLSPVLVVYFFRV